MVNAATGETLSLNIISSYYVQKMQDERTFYRFEASWDSSLHNSALLNCCTPHGSCVYVTISSSVDIENTCQPLVISKDLCLVLCPRTADSTSRLRSSLRNFFLSVNPVTCSSMTHSLVDHPNCVSSLYELKLRRATSFDRLNADLTGESPGVQRRQRKVIDTSKIYVRGEEMLQGWRPRSDSLILEQIGRASCRERVLNLV